MVVFYEGAILFVDGQIAMSEDCCCGEDPGDCKSYSDESAPDSLTLRISGATNNIDNCGTSEDPITPTCSRFDADYVVDLVDDNVGSASTCYTTYSVDQVAKVGCPGSENYEYGYVSFFVTISYTPSTRTRRIDVTLTIGPQDGAEWTITAYDEDSDVDPYELSSLNVSLTVDPIDPKPGAWCDHTGVTLDITA